MSPFTSYSLLQCAGHDQRPREPNVGQSDDYRARNADRLNQTECVPERKDRLLSKVKCWVMSRFERA